VQINFLPDSYGVWTPTLTFVTPGDLVVSFSGGAQLGWWRRRGNSVLLSYVLQTTTFTHTTASGGLRVLGNPFTTENVSGKTYLGAFNGEGITKANYTQFNTFANFNASILNIVGMGSGQGASNVAAADMPTGTTKVLRGSVEFDIA
jgi:hypothetical protein